MRCIRLLLIGCLALGATACGPLTYWSDISGAEEQLARAGQQNAQTFAAYEYYSARVYLDKAREEAGEGHYEEAIRFARNADEFAQQATRRAANPVSELR